MKNFLVILICLVCISCETRNQINLEIKQLKQTKEELSRQIPGLKSIVERDSAELIRIQEKIREAKIYESGKMPKYIIKIKISQSRVSLDLWEHAKDAMNAVEMEIPVDKDFYNSVSVGSKLVNELRKGSLLVNGSISSWDITVLSKRFE